MIIRASLGTLIELGIVRGELMARPNIAYIMQYSESGCVASCLFCAQSRSSRADKSLLARVVWPEVSLDVFLKRLSSSNLRRVCIQTVMKRGFIDEAHELVSTIASVNKEISLSITPLSVEELKRFEREGVDHVGIGLDAASKEVFLRVRKPFSWKRYWKFIDESVNVFGEGNVVVHIIVGLGESIRDIVDTVVRVRKLGANTSLFAFTPVRGTELQHLSSPPILKYRLVQLIVELIYRGYDPKDFLKVIGDTVCISKDVVEREDLYNLIKDSFLTRGCPGCNRPFYNESPGAEPYNFPDVSYISKYLSKLVNEVKALLC